MRQQKYTRDNNTVHKDQLQLAAMHIGKATQGGESTVNWEKVQTIGS